MAKEPTVAQAKDAVKPSGKSPPSKGKKKHRDPRPMPDVARMYIDDQAEGQTPMVFVTRDGELHGTVVDGGKYQHLLSVGGEPVVVKKLTLEYHYKQIDAETVAEKTDHEVGLDTEGLPDSLLYHRDFRLSNRDLWVSRKQHIPVRFTMRGSAQFTGLIEWFTPHAVKLNIGLRGEDGTASVVLHRHAVMRLELLEEPKEEPDNTPRE
jgi:hypothetical protein